VGRTKVRLIHLHSRLSLPTNSAGCDSANNNSNSNNNDNADTNDNKGPNGSIIELDSLVHVAQS